MNDGLVRRLKHSESVTPAVEDASKSEASRRSTAAGAGSPTSLVKLLVLSIIVHITLIPSIFDIYFTSPVVNVDNWYSIASLQPQVNLAGQPRHPDDIAPTALAKRVVVIVGDGLRADKLFQLYPDEPFPHVDPLPLPLRNLERKYRQGKPKPQWSGNGTSPAPYLRSLIESRTASWGVSHTRVPTESRPGHVALLAGMYEDPSAVTKGWQQNPVEFDSVFNRSTYSWGIGSADIIPMFVDGVRPRGRMQGITYSGEEEDFTADAVHLDIWAVDKLRELFANAKTQHDSTLKSCLDTEGIVIFLHLLGLDTTGHAYRPHGPEYYRNIRAVDLLVQETQNLVEQFYNDNNTAYIFSADHGMSSRGNHGDGHPDNTRTPLVAWGAGVAQSEERTEHEAVEDDEADWHLSHLRRKDIEQAGVAPLISTLLGNSIPGNNVGMLPKWYLGNALGRLGLEHRGLASLSVALQICEQYLVKDAFKRNHGLFYWPYDGMSYQDVNNKIAKLHYLAKAHRFARLDFESFLLAQSALEGLKYVQRYDWFVLCTLVVSAYSSWMLYCTIYLMRAYTSTLDSIPRQTSPRLRALNLLLTCSVGIHFIARRVPVTYYAYLLLPAFITELLSRDAQAIAYLLRFSLKRHAGQLSLLLCTVECMVLGYFNRRMWTLGYLFIGVVWPVSTLWSTVPKRILASWSFTACTTGIFTLLGVDRSSDISLVTIGAVTFLVARSGILFVRRSASLSVKRIWTLQTGFIVASLLTTIQAEKSLAQKLGLPGYVQNANWLLLAYIARHDLAAFDTIATAVLAFAPTFIILSLSYETLFFFSFAASLIAWHELECSITAAVKLAERAEQPRSEVDSSSKNTQSCYTLTSRHTRVGLFFLFFIHFGFFGPQNVASISSFYLEPVYRLIPVFNPFAMSALLLYKILIPFFIVALAFTFVSRVSGINPLALVLLSSIFSDILVVNFFFLVTDEGSWLEIGQSISHFVIASLLGVFELVLCAVGQSIVGRKARDDNKKQ